MIATILVSSSTFHAVEYNQQKVSEGKAELLEMSNFNLLSLSDSYTAKNLQDYLMDYSRRNTRIKNPQFHVVISCKGRTYSFPELVGIAHQYLHDMGYDQEEQPLLIYGHHDTDNNHIHIITSRIAPDGHKINHNQEKRRSLSIINHIMDKKEGENISEDVAKALSYHFESEGQFKAILESEGYECYEDGDTLEIKYGGNIIDQIKLSMIEKKKSPAVNFDDKRKRIRAFLLKYRDFSANKEELNAQMHKLFGISLVFIGKKDFPYGYIIVDHNRKSVMKGSTVVPIKQLLQFRSAEDRFEDAEKMVESMFQDNNRLTTRELNTKLRWQFGTKVFKGAITWGSQTHHLSEDVIKKLQANDKLAWLQSFRPSSDLECAILYRFGKIKDRQGLTKQEKKEGSLKKAVGRVKSIMDKSTSKNLRDRFFETGIRIYRFGDQYYCLDLQDRLIFCMNEQKLDLRLLHRVYGKSNIKQMQQGPHTPHVKRNGVKQITTQSGGSRDENREFEVGSHGNYDEIDNEKKLQR